MVVANRQNAGFDGYCDWCTSMSRTVIAVFHVVGEKTRRFGLCGVVRVLAGVQLPKGAARLKVAQV